MSINRVNLSNKLIEAISNPLFPEIDTQLRAGRHISSEEMEKFNFIHEYFNELDTFYRRYSVELIKAPESYFYLRTKSTSIIASSQLTELEMIVGKALCILYLSPEHLAQQGIFTADEVYEEITQQIEVEKLVKIINPRSTGSDLDKAKLFEKLRSALNRLARMGIITFLPSSRDKSKDKFVIRSACFRFGNEVRSGESSQAAIDKLVVTGEAVTPESLEQAKLAGIRSTNPDQDDEESLTESKLSANDYAEDANAEEDCTSQVSTHSKAKQSPTHHNPSKAKSSTASQAAAAAAAAIVGAASSDLSNGLSASSGALDADEVLSAEALEELESLANGEEQVDEYVSATFTEEDELVEQEDDFYDDEDDFANEDDDFDDEDNYFDDEEDFDDEYEENESDEDDFDDEEDDLDDEDDHFLDHQDDFFAQFSGQNKRNSNTDDFGFEKDIFADDEE